VSFQLTLVEEAMRVVGEERLVVVFLNGGSLTPDWISANCPTVIEALEGGQSGGTALGDILVGDRASPSGILPYVK
jgi:hypothetical protein